MSVFAPSEWLPSDKPLPKTQTRTHVHSENPANGIITEPTVSPSRLMRSEDLQALRQRRDILHDLKVAHGHCEAYQAGAGDQLIGWLDCLMISFAETCAYRDLYMLVEHWDGSGGRLEVLDCLRRLRQLTYSVSHTLLTHYINPMENAAACQTTTKFLRMIIDQHTLLNQRHITGFRLEAEWLANRRNRADYIRDATLQVAKDAVFLQTGNPTPGRFCETRYKHEWGHRAWIDWKICTSERERNARGLNMKPRSRTEISLPKIISNEESELQPSYNSETDMGIHGNRARKKKSNLGNDQATNKAINLYEDKIKSLVAARKKSGLVSHEIESRKKTTERSIKAGTITSNDIPEESTIPPAERCHFIDAYLLGNVKGGSPEDSDAPWNTRRQTAAMLRSRTKAKSYSHKGEEALKPGKRAESNDDGDSLMGWLKDLRAEGDVTTPINPKGKQADRASLDAILSISWGSIRSPSNKATPSLPSLQQEHNTAGTTGTQEGSGTAQGSVFSMGGSGNPGTGEESGITGTERSGNSTASGSESQGSSVNTWSTSSGTSISLSMDRSLSRDSQSAASSEAFRQEQLWRDHMSSKVGGESETQFSNSEASSRE